MEAEVIPDGLRAEEDISFTRHHQDKPVQSLRRQTPPSSITAAFYCLVTTAVNNSVFCYYNSTVTHEEFDREQLNCSFALWY